MTNDFNIQKVSSQVKADVAKAISGGKVSTAADKVEEYDALSKILSGTSNADEQKYIKKHMDEYNNKYKLQDFRERATTYARGIVDKIKNLVKADGKLDADEADHLALELTKAMEEGRTEDSRYLIVELQKAGFGGKVDKAIDDYFRHKRSNENEPNNAKQGPTTSSGKNTAKSDAGQSRPRNAK